MRAGGGQRRLRQRRIQADLSQKVILGADWQPLQPIVAEREGPVVRARFQAPVARSSGTRPCPATHQGTEWATGRGFGLRSGSTPLEIVSTEIVGDVVEIAAAADVPAGATVGYAVTSDGVVISGCGHRVGQLRDSDPFVGRVTGAAQPNDAVAFELNVP